MVQKDFPRFAHNEKLACILMNNVQQLRVQLEKIYENMGGSELDTTANQVLTNLQKKLNSVLDKLSGQFVTTLEPHILEQAVKLGALLQKIKGPQLQKSQLSGVSGNISIDAMMRHGVMASEPDCRRTGRGFDSRRCPMITKQYEGTCPEASEETSKEVELAIMGPGRMMVDYER